MKNRYEFRGDHVVVFIERKGIILECLIDLEDFDRVNSIKGRWFAEKHHSGNFYVRGPLKSSKVFLHRLLMCPLTSMVVDHINNDPLDNRRANMRVITNAENKQNLKGARSDSVTGVRGVSFNKKDNLWVARLKVNGKCLNLGCFKMEDEAREAVEQGRKKHMPFSKEALTKVG